MPKTYDPNSTRSVIDALNKAADAMLEAKAKAAETPKETTKSLDARRNLAGMFASGQAPNAIIGERSERGYSMVRAAQFMMRMIGEDKAKEEVQIHKKLKSLYEKNGFYPESDASFLIPLSGKRLMFRNAAWDEGEKLAKEITEKMLAGVGQTTKASNNMAVIADGGWAQGLPNYGDMIDVISNATWLDKAGATQVDLGPSNVYLAPKRRTRSAGYWVGEGEDATQSTPKGDVLKMQGKKIRVFSSYTNELLKFSGPNQEALFREDLAITAAQLIDTAALTGDGSKEPRGLYTYDTQTAFSQGTDKVIKITATTTGSNGDTFVWGDDGRLWEALPVAVTNGGLTWVMKKNVQRYIANLRADAVSAGDKAGAALYKGFDRRYMDVSEMFQGGGKILNAETLPNRTKGSGTTLQALLCGDFSQCLYATSPVMEVLVDNLTGALADQTKFYGTMFADVGFKQLAAFGYIDNLLIP